MGPSPPAAAGRGDGSGTPVWYNSEVRSIAEQISAKRAAPEAVVGHVPLGADVIVPLANGEPKLLIEAIDQAAADERIDRVRVHQMHAAYDHPHLHGDYGDRLRHVSYFLSAVERCGLRRRRLPARAGALLRHAEAAAAHHELLAAGGQGGATRSPRLLLARDERRLLGPVPGRDPDVPRGQPEHAPHVRREQRPREPDRRLVRGRTTRCVDVAPAPAGDLDRRIAALVAERIPDGATIQVGIGGVPNALLPLLEGHRDLGIHTELLSDGVVDLIESGAATGAAQGVPTGQGRHHVRARHGPRLRLPRPTTRSVEMLPVDWVNDPRVIGREHHVRLDQRDRRGRLPRPVQLGDHRRSVLVGQRRPGRLRQRGDALARGPGLRGARTRPHGTARSSRIVPRLSPGAAVTTDKNTVDKVVTEFGVAELRGRTIGERTRALIAIAHPDHRDELARAAHEMGSCATGAAPR